MIWLGVQKRGGSDGGERRSVWVGAPRTAIKLTIRPLLCDSLSRSYKTIFVFVIVLVLLCTRVSWHEGVPPGDPPTRSAPQDRVRRAKGMKRLSSVRTRRGGGRLVLHVWGMV